ncbi:MAG: hypothetical protein ACKV2V_01445 [Blastocatellia bacterium]
MLGGQSPEAKGHINALFAFDVGHEVSLDKLAALTPATPAQPLSQRKRAPAWMQYARPPHVVDLGAAPPLAGQPGRLHATVYDFGAISLAFRWPLQTTIDALPELSVTLHQANLETQARARLDTLLTTIRTAITRPETAPLVEDYFLFVIEEIAGIAPVNTAQLLATHGGALARTLQFDTAALSAQQQAETLSRQVSYYEHDLALIDWNAAIVIDHDYEDTVAVLEFLNVELLEARYVDAQLDRRIRDYARLVRERGGWLIPLHNPYKKIIHELAELRAESSLLAERVDNSLKLIGDQYLSRIHNAATERFYLPEWERAITRKLDIIEDFYDVLNDRVHTAQSQTLEIIVVILILIEIVMGLSH